MAVPFINKENAAALGRKGAAATAEKWKQARSIADLKSIVSRIVVSTDAATTDNYVQKRLVRVRKQIDILSTRMEELLDADDLDAQAVDRVASALDKLGKLEQVLAGRPGPGNRKPAPDRPQRRQSAPEPQPIVVAQPITNVVQMPNSASRDEPNG